MVLFENPSIGIGPNTGTGYIKVWTNGANLYVQNNNVSTQPEQLFIYDLLGRSRYQAELSVNTLDVVRTGLPGGYYVVRVVTTDEVMTKKVYLQ